MAKYTIGVDFGTLSGRGVIVDVATGAELADSTYDYPHAVMDEYLPDGTRLGHDWALQYPQDYLEVLYNTIPAVLKASSVAPKDVIGIGIDFTASTFMPVKADGTPLCFLDEFKGNPHAYVKLWKHHAAQDKANKLNEIAARRGEDWLDRYGGKISSEWQVPKVWQVLDESPEVYNAADYFVEAADWVVWQLSGAASKNTCTAGYKGIWHGQDGYPSPDFYKALDPRLENYISEKLNYPIAQLGTRVGGITSAMAARSGLVEGTAVAAANVDAHVTASAVGITEPGKLCAIMGTSTCDVLLGVEEHNVPGMCGVVEGGIYPGFYGYEAGQSCVGDHFAWFVDNCLPGSYLKEAEERGISAHELLSEKAEGLRPGESGLLALDWWNGNRSVLVDVDLTGLMLGMTLQTKPEEMYRALVEATAYGTRKIVETFRTSGVPVDEFYAAGGISQKNSMIMQIYSDVLNMPVRISGSKNAPALGSAIFAAVAAGKASGGYNEIFSAARAMGKLKDEAYFPIAENAAVYDRLYTEYDTLHDYFGRGANDVMKRLKEIKNSI